MISRPFAFGSTLLLAALLPWGWSGLVCAQFDDDVEPEDKLAVRQAFEIDPINFDHWAFGNAGGRDAGVARLNLLLTVRCASIDQVCGLTAEQRRKLELAGHGDIKRFIDQTERLRERFMVVRRDQELFNRFWQEMQPIMNRINPNFFGERSLFAKTVRGMLTSEQSATYEAIEREHMTYRLRAKIELTVEEIETTIPLTDEQREQLIELLVDQQPAPRQMGNLDAYLVLYRLGKVPEDKLRKLLDETQFKALTNFRRQGQAMEATLIANGVLEPKDKAAPPAKRAP